MSSKLFPRSVLIHVVVCILWFGGVRASIGPWHHWGVARIDRSSPSCHNKFSGGNEFSNKSRIQLKKALSAPRGGQEGALYDKDDPALNGALRVVGAVAQGTISVVKAVIPPVLTVVQHVFGFYQALPRDAIIAQIGLVYCFAGGYYPTLFSSLQAARQCGWDVMTEAIQDLTDEAIKVIDASADIRWDHLDRKNQFLRQANIVLKTVDPVRINQAMGALYTTWLGVSAVLEREYARVISLSLTLAYYFELVAHWVLEPPVKYVVHEDYHKWVPVVIGWGAKAAAMNIAWRIQRVLTASTSAMTGGIMFARALLRMAHKRGITLFGWIDETGQESPLDEIIGFAVAALGFWTQIEVQYKNNFSFEVPFPLSLITWPFDWLEKWIQWVVTKEE